MSLVTTIRDLHRRKARERRGLALAEGIRLVEEMVAAGVPCKGAAVSPALAVTERGAALRSLLASRGVTVEEVSDGDLAELAATEHPQGILAVYQPRIWQLDDLNPGAGHPLVLLDAVQDPGNVGTIARTALAFGAAGIIALPGTVDLTNPKVVRSSAGALFRLPSLHGDLDAVLEWCGRNGVELWVTAMDGEAVTQPADAPVALVLGNEGAGISEPVAGAAIRRVSIPIRAEAESLNVAVAAGIFLNRLGST
ncbi:MAG TPA: RNA methyltransferase [Gemmatimonadales bacterium]|nr:RNA methyltransferase [Gemmatimonadales bacterium]